VAEKVDIFMPLFVADYLADTTDLTTEEHGAYLLLLMASWRNGGTITSDHAKLARIAKLSPARWRAAWESLSRFFVVDGDSMHQKRLRAEHEKAMGRKLAASESGRLGAAAKHGIHVLSGTTRSQRMTAARAIATHSELQWETLVSEFNGRCVRCGSSGHKPERDHIIPIYQGGHDGIDNIQPVCPRCNSSKGSETTNWAEYRRKNGWGTPSEMPGVATAKCVSDSDSSPSPSPSPSPSEISPPACDPTAAEQVAVACTAIPAAVADALAEDDDHEPVASPPTGLWSADEWRRRFGAAWSRDNANMPYGRGAGDAKAVGTLAGMLEDLGLEGRVDAQASSGRMFEEFLGDRSPKAVAERHQFSLFVLNFNGLRAPKKQAEVRAIGPPGVQIGPQYKTLTPRKIGPNP